MQFSLEVDILKQQQQQQLGGNCFRKILKTEVIPRAPQKFGF